MAKSIDWNNLGFAYSPVDYRYSATYKDGAWSKGELITDPVVHISECAAVLQYAQTVFEGLKAYTTKDGRIVVFRPDLNAKRLVDSARRLVIPEVPEEMFLEAVDKVVAANRDYVPPFGSGASLYLRPFIYGSGPQIAVAPASEFEFRLIAMPVGPYFKGGVAPIHIRVSERDRTAPRGTGDIKAGLNYAMSIREGEDAHAAGFADNLYLDPSTRTKVEEASGANIIFVTRDGKLVTPKSDTILPSVTRRSLMVVAEKYLGMEVEEREVLFEELPAFAECGLCGTAAVVSPVGKISYADGVVEFPSGMKETGATIRKLYDTLTGIQLGTVPAPEGWIHEVR